MQTTTKQCNGYKCHDTELNNTTTVTIHGLFIMITGCVTHLLLLIRHHQTFKQTAATVAIISHTTTIRTIYIRLVQSMKMILSVLFIGTMLL